MRNAQSLFSAALAIVGDHLRQISSESPLVRYLEASQIRLSDAAYCCTFNQHESAIERGRAAIAILDRIVAGVSDPSYDRLLAANALARDAVGVLVA